jgi:hypothetical protein
MTRIERFESRERAGDLLRRGPPAVEHDSPDLRPEIAENGVEVGDGWIQK